MDYQDRYDELDNLIRNLDVIVDELTDKDYVDKLNEIKYEAQNEKDEISEILEDEIKRGERQQEFDYWRNAM